MILDRKHVMIDIETFGTKPTAPILSIAAQPFSFDSDPAVALPTPFYMKADINSCLDAGCRLELDTVKWWMKRSKEEQKHVTEHDGLPLEIVLLKLQDYLWKYDQKDLCVWGNSARFDFGILENAFDSFNMALPWLHYNELDVRTIVAFNPEIKRKEKFEGVKHDPVYDCLHQIKYVKRTMQWIGIEFAI